MMVVLYGMEPLGKFAPSVISGSQLRRARSEGVVELLRADPERSITTSQFMGQEFSNLANRATRATGRNQDDGARL